MKKAFVTLMATAALMVLGIPAQSYAVPLAPTHGSAADQLTNPLSGAGNDLPSKVGSPGTVEQAGPGMLFSTNPDTGFGSEQDGRVAAVPEPSTLFILGSALAGLGLMRRRSKP